MPRTLTVLKWLEDLEAHLAVMEATDGARLSRLVEFGGGFESWLKFEMAMLLTREPWGYRPWIDDVAGDVGVEYRAALKNHETKLIDLWASPTRGAKSWHFVELKVAFDNYNAPKQFASWRSDFEALRRIDPNVPLQVPESIASVMFAVGIQQPAFDALVKASGAAFPSWCTSVPLRHGDLRIAALLK